MLSYMKDHIDQTAMIIWLLIYWTISIKSNLNIGIRHLMPAYPFMIILISGQASLILEKLKQRSRKSHMCFTVLVVALVGWYVTENIRVFPSYLAYFNQIAGGSDNGYRYVADSNLDWGQDLERLSTWVKENNIPKIEVDYFGWADPVYYLRDRYIGLSNTKYLSREDFLSRNQTDGWIAVSATFLQQAEGPTDKPNLINYSWIRSYTPITTIGYSIFIYRIIQ